MKYLIGIGLLAALCAGGVEAQDGERRKQLAEIERLEARAEKLLDAGRRAEAFDALARAAVLRDSLKKSGKPAPKAKKAGKAKAEPKGKAKPKVRKPEVSAVTQAANAFDRAVRSGNMEGIRRAAADLRAASLAAEKSQREQLAAERRKRKQLERRLTELEQQLMALKKLMER